MRLFTGIELPAQITSTLEGLLAQLRPAAHLKWSPVYNLHITLKFIGEWPGERLDEVKTALAGMPRRGPAPIEVRGLSWMPNPRHPRLFWATINAPALTAVAADMEAALQPLGIAKEDRAYTPHLTLARVRMPTPLGKVQTAIAQLQSVDFGSFTADRFWLYLSEPGAANTIYTKLAEFPFGA